MSKEKDPEVVMVAKYILRYLDEHPEAADTSEGISKCWLKKYGHMWPIEKVQSAIEYLRRHDCIHVQGSESSGLILYSSPKKGLKK